MTVADLRKQEGLLMDSNLMLLYCVGRYDPLMITQFTERLSRYTVDDYKLLVQFIGLFRKVITTPNVLTEVVNLIDKRSGRYDKLLQQFAVDIATLEEKYIPSSIVVQNHLRHFPTFGMTDLVLYEIAQQSILVLTDDNSLWSFLAGDNCSALNFNQLRALLIQKGRPSMR